MMRPRGPVLVFKQNAKRESGRKAQLANIQASKAIADIVRTTLGPCSMLKMLLDPLGGIVITNDGNSILREVDVLHPAAKSMIELSRNQEEEVGDGSTSVIIIGGEILINTINLLINYNIHPVLIVQGYLHALNDLLLYLDNISISIDNIDINKQIQPGQGGGEGQGGGQGEEEEKESLFINCLLSSLCTKFSANYQHLLTKMAINATKKIARLLPSGKLDIDIKRYCKIEKIPGGDIEDSCMINGIMLNKDVVHPKMKRFIKNPKILLLDCPLEYKKGESQTSIEITREEEWCILLEEEEKEINKLINNITKYNIDLLITEKGVSDLAIHFLNKKGVSVIRRIKKTDNNRLSRATGATIVNRPEEITPQDIGHNCKLFKIEKIGDEYYSFFLDCEEGSACTILLRGGSKDVLNEVERNLQDALCVSRNILLEGKVVPGGGATEMALAARLLHKAKSIDSVHQYAYRAVAASLEVIPRTLAQNCGANVVKVMTDLRASHSRIDCPIAACMGINGKTGEITNMRDLMVWDCLTVKQQVYKTAIEAAAMLLRIDDVLSGLRKDTKGGEGGEGGAVEDMETFGDSRDG